LEIAWQGWRPAGQARLIQLSGDDPKAANSFDNPERVAPRDLGWVQLQDGKLELALPPLSFSVLVWDRGQCLSQKRLE
jgi:alpha-N-arabinofuranosidase